MCWLWPLAIPTGQSSDSGRRRGTVDRGRDGRSHRLNAESHWLIPVGDLDGFRRLLERLPASLLKDPIGGFLAAMDKAPETDRVVMGDPDWQARHALATREALRAGVDGWFDEAIALERAWSEIDLSAVGTSLTWWLAGSDANVPLSAAHNPIPPGPPP